MTVPAKKNFDSKFPIVVSGGNPSQSFRDYMFALDRLVAALAAGNLTANLVSAVDDAAAAAAGVPLGAIYRTPTTGVPPHTVSALQVRVS